MSMIELKSSVPSFTLLDQDSKSHQPSDYLGKWLVIYFYPKASTPGCTTQACGIRDIIPELAAMNVQVVGVSPDQPAKLKKFAIAQKLPFVLLSDPNHEFAEKFGVWQLKKFMGKTFMGIIRTTFIVDPEGKIAAILDDFKTTTHHETLKVKLQQLMSAK